MASGKPAFLALPSFKRKRDEAFPSASVSPLPQALPSAGPAAEEASSVVASPTGSPVGGSWASQATNPQGWLSSLGRSSSPRARTSQPAPVRAPASMGLQTAKPPQSLHNQYEAAPLDFEVVDPERVPWCRPPTVKVMKKGAGKLLRFVLGNGDGEGEHGMYQLGRGEPSQGGKIYFDRDLRRRLEVSNYTPPPGTLGIDRFGLPAPALPYFVRDVHGSWKPVKASRWMYLSADPSAGAKAGDVAPRPRPEDLPIGEVAPPEGKGKAVEKEQEAFEGSDHGGAASSVSDYGVLTWSEVAGDPPSSNVLVVSGMEGTIASITEGEGLATLLALQAQPVSIIRSQGQTFFEMIDVSAALRAVHPLRRLWPQATIEFTPKHAMDSVWERFDELWMPEVEEGEVTGMDVDEPLVQPGAVDKSSPGTENCSRETIPFVWEQGAGSTESAWGHDSDSWSQWGASSVGAWSVDPATSGWDLPGPGEWVVREVERASPLPRFVGPVVTSSDVAPSAPAAMVTEESTEPTTLPSVVRVNSSSVDTTTPEASSPSSGLPSLHAVACESPPAPAVQRPASRVVKPLPTGPRAFRQARTAPSAQPPVTAIRTGASSETPNVTELSSASSPPALLSRLRDPRPLLGRLRSPSPPDGVPLKSLLERIADVKGNSLVTREPSADVTLPLLERITSASGSSLDIRVPGTDVAPPRAVKRKSAKRRERDVARAIRRQSRILQQATEAVVGGEPMFEDPVAAPPLSTPLDEHDEDMVSLGEDCDFDDKTDL